MVIEILKLQKNICMMYAIGKAKREKFGERNMCNGKRRIRKGI